MISLKDRFRLIAIDQTTMIILVMLLIMPFSIYFSINNESTLHGNYGSGKHSIFFSIYNFIVLSIYINKDIINGRSIGKRITGYQIVDFNNKIAPSALRCLLRNLTIIIWPIEVVFIVLNTSRRLGDYIAGTELINTDSNSSKIIKFNYIQIFMSLLLPVIILILSKSLLG